MNECKPSFLIESTAVHSTQRKLFCKRNNEGITEQFVSCHVSSENARAHSLVQPNETNHKNYHSFVATPFLI
jgi:hypothetical protein